MQIKENEYLREHTTFRVGGPAPRYYIPESIEELIELLREHRESGVPFRILGNGSNLLVSDAGVDFDVIEIRGRLEGVELLDAERVRALAGTQLARAARFAQQQGLEGMEALHGIPGTVGGALVMNAGAYGTEIRDVLESCEVLTRTGERLRLSPEELALSYRHSCIEEKGYTVLSATFRLRHGAAEEIAGRMQDYRTRRMEKQPLNLASAGSTFRRPEGQFAGKLIEEAGLRGFSLGGAQVSEKHCGFIVNRGAASAAELYALISEVIRRVEAHSSVILKPEVKMWGSF